MNRLVIAPSILVADFGPPAEEVPAVDAWPRKSRVFAKHLQRQAGGVTDSNNDEGFEGGRTISPA
jgi:hypothetical protein